MPFDAPTLSRLPFSFTVALHTILAGFTLGLASYLAVLDGLWLGGGNEQFMRLYRFWARIFAVCFAVGVVSAAVAAFEIATGLGPYSTAALPTAAPRPVLAALAAVSLGAGLLGVLLVGWKRRGAGLHFAASLLVAAGALAGAIWLLSADGGARALFSPTLSARLVRTILAAYLTTAVVVGAASAWRLLKDPHEPESCVALKMSIGMYAIVAPLQLLAADRTAGAAAALAPGLAIVAVGFWGAFHIWRGHIARAQGFLRACMAMAPAGFVALVAGIVSDVGHEPAHAAPRVASAAPLLAFGTAYALIFGAGVLYVLKLMAVGPGAADGAAASPHRASRLGLIQADRDRV